MMPENFMSHECISFGPQTCVVLICYSGKFIISTFYDTISIFCPKIKHKKRMSDIKVKVEELNLICVYLFPIPVSVFLKIRRGLTHKHLLSLKDKMPELKRLNVTVII